MRLVFLPMAVALISGSGCTAAQVYGSSQPQRIRDCERLSSTEREACLALERETYYEREKRVAE